MKRKIVIFALVALIAVGMVFALAACNDGSSLLDGRFVKAPDSVYGEAKAMIVYLGDSIAEGILGSSPLSLRHEYSYPSLVGRVNDFTYYNHSVSGHLSKDLLALISHEEGYDGARALITHVAQADIIHISILGNDVLQDRADGAYADNPVTMHSIIVEAALNEGVARFTSIDRVLNGEGDTPGSVENLVNIVKRLKELNPDAAIIFQSVYNPIMDVDTPLIKQPTRDALAAGGFEITLESLHEMGALLIGRLNSALDSAKALLEEEGYENPFYVVSGPDALNAVYNADKERAERLIYPDGIHPSNEGHAVLAAATQGLLVELGLADADDSLAAYKELRKNNLTDYFAASVDVAAVSSDIDAAGSFDAVSEIYFDAIAGKSPVY